MKTVRKILIVSFFAVLLAAQRPWQQLSFPTLREVAANFKSPPHDYGAMQPFLSWNGGTAEERKARIVQDLDRLSANGVFLANIAPGRGTPAYLSPEHMQQMRFIVQEAEKRGMKLWLQDESDYPSGFAGGKISQQVPELGMQAMVADIRVRVSPGQTLSMPAPADTLAIFAEKRSPDQQSQGIVPIPVPPNGQLKWTVPAEGSTPNEPRLTWEVIFVRHIYVSSPTRNNNRADGTRAKDGLYSLIDYLDPNATRAFLRITHDTYHEALGDQFGKTVMGFFGDEPDYSVGGMPWTPRLLEEFQRAKGYDLKPWISKFFEGKLSDEAQRVKADYFDVWSNIFKDSFYGEQAAWCAKNNVEYLVHLNHEETMTALIRSEGDYFRDNRYVQVPGIDNLDQLVPAAVHTPDGTWRVNNNFPKLASSAAHLFGRPKVWSEEGGGAGVDGKFQLDFQLVRGVNLLQLRLPIRAIGGATSEPGPIPPQAPLIASYANRGAYLMAMGRPAAQVGIYHPANSIWMADDDADRSTTKIGWQLLEHQIDWDYFDEQSLSSVATIENGGFRNLSGQVYRAIVVPSTAVITRTGLERFQAFVKAGGKLIFVGRTPGFVVDQSFLNSKEKPDLSFATLIEPSGDITARVLAVLPKPDVKLDAEFARLTYSHRAWRDAEMYLFFNESNKEETRMATLSGHGPAQLWDLTTGEIHPISGAAVEGDAVRVPLQFEPYETKVVVLGPLPAGAGSPVSAAAGTLLADLTGDWSLDLNGKQSTTALKSWEALGTQASSGPAVYKKQFNAPAAAGKHVYLEMVEVHDYARIKINGKELEGHAFQPYRWDVTNALRSGSNDLEVEVRNTPPGRPAGGGASRAGPPVSGLMGPVRLVVR